MLSYTVDRHKLRYLGKLLGVTADLQSSLLCVTRLAETPPGPFGYEPFVSLVNELGEGR